LGEPRKGKIGVLIEEHFDMTEFRLFNESFPKHGYQVVYLSHLWGNAFPHLRFQSRCNGWVEEHVLVETEITSVTARTDYKGIIIIGAYASDRLRYQVTPRKGEPNQAPAVVFIRRALAAPSEDRHDLPQLVAALRRPRAAAGPPGHLRPQHRL
jgi:protease I